MFTFLGAERHNSENNASLLGRRRFKRKVVIPTRHSVPFTLVVFYHFVYFLFYVGLALFDIVIILFDIYFRCLNIGFSLTPVPYRDISANRYGITVVFIHP